MNTNRLRMAFQISRNLLGRLADPACHHHLGMELPIRRGVMALGQFTHCPFFLLVLSFSRFHLLGHLFAPSSEHFHSIVYHH